MQKVKATLWQLSPEEIVNLPKGTQVIEYCTLTGRMRVIKTGKVPAWDFFSCLYLLVSSQKDEPSEERKVPGD